YSCSALCPYTTLFRSGSGYGRCGRLIKEDGRWNPGWQVRCGPFKGHGRRVAAGAADVESSAICAARRAAGCDYRDAVGGAERARSEEHTSELQSRVDL